MQEMLFRGRNREFIKQVTLISAVEILTQEVAALLLPLNVTDDVRRASHTHIKARFARLTKLVEDEVFEEAYMPERIREEERAAREERMAEIRRKAEEVEIARRVQGFSQDH